MRAKTVGISTIAIFAISACVAPRSGPPKPTNVQSWRSPAEVVQAAAVQLVADGFELMSMDGRTGQLKAKRVRTSEQQGDALECGFVRGSVGSRETAATLSVTVEAHAAKDKAPNGGSDVSITSDVTTDYSALASSGISTPPSDVDCVSTGAVEKRVSDAVR